MKFSNTSIHDQLRNSNPRSSVLESNAYPLATRSQCNICVNSIKLQSNTTSIQLVRSETPLSLVLLTQFASCWSRGSRGCCRDNLYRKGSQNDWCTGKFLCFVKSETPLSLVLGGIRTHNLLIFGLTTEPGINHIVLKQSLASSQITLVMLVHADVYHVTPGHNWGIMCMFTKNVHILFHTSLYCMSCIRMAVFHVILNANFQHQKLFMNVWIAHLCLLHFNGCISSEILKDETFQRMLLSCKMKSYSYSASFLLFKKKTLQKRFISSRGCKQQKDIIVRIWNFKIL